MSQNCSHRRRSDAYRVWSRSVSSCVGVCLLSTELSDACCVSYIHFALLGFLQSYSCTCNNLILEYVLISPSPPPHTCPASQCPTGAQRDASLTQTWDDACPICAQKLSTGPCLRVQCGHVLHASCVETRINHGYNGADISFGHLNCPLCSLPALHPSLAPLLLPWLELQAVVRGKARSQLTKDGLEGDEGAAGDPTAYAQSIYVYQKCSKCEACFFAGRHECQAAGGGGENKEGGGAGGGAGGVAGVGAGGGAGAGADADVDAKDKVLCQKCLVPNSVTECKKHGTDFIQWKCRYCCGGATCVDKKCNGLAVWTCFGYFHACDSCHSYAQLQVRREGMSMWGGRSVCSRILVVGCEREGPILYGEWNL